MRMRTDAGAPSISLVRAQACAQTAVCARPLSIYLSLSMHIYIYICMSIVEFHYIGCGNFGEGLYCSMRLFCVVSFVFFR